MSCRFANAIHHVPYLLHNLVGTFPMALHFRRFFLSRRGLNSHTFPPFLKQVGLHRRSYQNCMFFERRVRRFLAQSWILLNFCLNFAAYFVLFSELSKGFLKDNPKGVVRFFQDLFLLAFLPSTHAAKSANLKDIMVYNVLNLWLSKLYFPR